MSRDWHPLDADMKNRDINMQNYF